MRVEWRDLFHSGDEMKCRLLCVGCLLVVTLAVAVRAAAQARLLPTPPEEGINRVQPFDQNVPDSSVYGGRVYFVWGSQSPGLASPVVGSKYLPYSRDPNRAHTLEWYRQNHPDWIEYQADRKTPAYGYTYARGNAMSIDITNPSVREWYWNTYVEPAIQANYPLVALDNVNPQNLEKRVGHYDLKGSWVSQFSGQRVDDAYTAAAVGWMQYLCKRLHARGMGIAANITFPLGKPTLEPAMRRLVEMVDLWADEQGFTRHSDVEVADELWQQKFQFVRSVEAIRIHAAVNEMTSQHLSDASRQQVEWAVANYYLYREKDSLLSLSGAQEYGVFLDRPALHIDLGRPSGEPTEDRSGAWFRNYSRGLVAVNPSSTKNATLQLPPGRWIDPQGDEHQGRIELLTISGALLLKR